MTAISHNRMEDLAQLKVLLARSINDLCREKLGHPGIFSSKGNVEVITNNNQVLNITVEHVDNCDERLTSKDEVADSEAQGNNDTVHWQHRHRQSIADLCKKIVESSGSGSFDVKMIKAHIVLSLDNQDPLHITIEEDPVEEHSVLTVSATTKEASTEPLRTEVQTGDNDCAAGNGMCHNGLPLNMIKEESDINPDPAVNDNRQEPCGILVRTESSSHNKSTVRQHASPQSTQWSVQHVSQGLSQRSAESLNSTNVYSCSTLPDWIKSEPIENDAPETDTILNFQEVGNVEGLPIDFQTAVTSELPDKYPCLKSVLGACLRDIRVNVVKEDFDYGQGTDSIIQLKVLNKTQQSVAKTKESWSKDTKVDQTSGDERADAKVGFSSMAIKSEIKEEGGYDVGTTANGSQNDGTKGTSNGKCGKYDNPRLCTKCWRFTYASFKRHKCIFTTGVKQHICKTCGLECPSQSALKRHRYTHTTGKPTCKVCGKQFTDSSSLGKHRYIHTGRNPYVCEVCGRGFARPSSLKTHMYSHTGEKPYVCEKCGKRFTYPSGLESHMHTHTGEKPHVCTICGKGFGDKSTLTKHMNAHTGEKRFVCEICDKKFTHSVSLRRHKYTHSGQTPYVCETCGKGFSNPGKLKDHVNIHTGERPFVCKTCGNAFANASTLKGHEYTHITEKRFVCKICGKGFDYESRLKTHSYKHTGLKPYACKTCGKRFSLTNSLMKHEYLHSREKPFACKSCGERFVHESLLKKHKCDNS